MTEDQEKLVELAREGHRRYLHKMLCRVMHRQAKERTMQRIREDVRLHP